jgi:Tfp pilus assembly protein PilO
MKTLTQRERFLVMAAAGVALLILVLAISSPAGEGSRALKQAQRNHATVKRDLDAVKAEMATLQQQVEGRMVVGTRAKLVREMIQSAQTAARASGLRLADVKPDEPEVIAGLQRIPVHLTVSTRFPEAARFLYELERASTGCHVEQVRLVARDPRSDRLDLELRLVAFMAEEEKTNAKKG